MCPKIAIYQSKLKSNFCFHFNILVILFSDMGVDDNLSNTPAKNKQKINSTKIKPQEGEKTPASVGASSEQIGGRSL